MLNRTKKRPCWVVKNTLEMERLRIGELACFAERVPGWLTRKEGVLLYKLAKRCPPSWVIVEIGSWQGRSTSWLGHGSRAGASVPVYAVDPHRGGDEHAWTGCPETFALFMRTIQTAGLTDLVHPLVMTSREAAAGFDRPVGLLFIDGNHEYCSVNLDYSLWHPKLMPGGTIALHDACGRTGLPGPRRIVEEHILGTGAYRDIVQVGSIVAAIKAA